MSNLKRGHELEEPPYDYHEINQFEQVAFTKFTHVDEVRYDDTNDEIVLMTSIEMTGDRERIIADQLQDVAGELGVSFQVVDVADERVRVSMPSTFKFE